MKSKANFYLGYCGPEWDKKIQDKDNPNFWKYGVANLVFADLMKGRKSILDVGCGTGGLTLFLAEHGEFDYIVGMDPVKSMVEVARQHAFQRSLADRTDFVIGDGRYLPFRQLYFDALVSRGDAFVFLVPQKTALIEFKRVLKNGAVVVIEIDNVRWKPGETISSGFEKMINGAIAYSVESFDVRRDHVKVFYVLNPQSTIVKKIRSDDEFVKTGRLKREFPLKEIRKAAIETRQGSVTHWPTLDEIRMLFRQAGFKNIEIFGDGLLMGLLQEGDQKMTATMKKQPELFFEIERKLIPFIDPRKGHTIILKAEMP
ncbi:MAG: class I SAM-dependent methyltransferase [Candidatus Bathyarchaeota archaeon]|nr:class I SAM-dependent methyltransferase [Candidatus Bathyarchaeota archaeon]